MSFCFFPFRSTSQALTSPGVWGTGIGLSRTLIPGVLTRTPGVWDEHLEEILKKHKQKESPGTLQRTLPAKRYTMRVEWLLGLSPDILGYPAGSPFSGTSGPRRCHGDRGDERGQKETKKDTPAERERKDSPSEIHQEALPRPRY